MKRELRKNLRKLRDELTDRVCRDAKICEAFLASECFLNAETVLLYYSVNSEVSTKRIFKTCLEMDKRVAFPICLDKNGTMDFFLVKSEADLEEGMYNIVSPKKGSQKLKPDSSCLCVVPGISFDKEGYRLGYGKGYYDRYLNGFPGVSVGLCYDELVTDELPRDEYDKKVNYLITDKKTYNFYSKEDLKNG